MARTKITEDSVNAFIKQRRFRRSNTAVKNEFDGTTTMYLFGNIIARYIPRKNKLWVDTCGRTTATTKERLNGILKELNAGKIYQRDYVWYYVDRLGNTHTMPIHNGMFIDLNDYTEFRYLQL